MSSELQWNLFFIIHSENVGLDAPLHYKAATRVLQGPACIIYTHTLSYTHSHSQRGGGRKLLNQEEMCGGLNTCVFSAKQQRLVYEHTHTHNMEGL